MKYLLIVLGCGLITGCTHMLPVVTLESEIQNTALAAQRAAGDAASVARVEVSVATGFRVGTTVPIQVVPITAEHTRSVTTTLTIDIDLKKFKGEQRFKEQPPQYMLLNPKTGELTEVRQQVSSDTP